MVAVYGGGSKRSINSLIMKQAQNSQLHVQLSRMPRIAIIFVAILMHVLDVSGGITWPGQTVWL